MGTDGNPSHLESDDVHKAHREVDANGSTGPGESSAHRAGGQGSSKVNRRQPSRYSR